MEANILKVFEKRRTGDSFSICNFFSVVVGHSLGMLFVTLWICCFRYRRSQKIYVLENGLKVILKEDHSAPVAAVQVWVKTGSANETIEEAGITHQIEHMIFKGTPSKEHRRNCPHHRDIGGQNQRLYLL